MSSTCPAPPEVVWEWIVDPHKHIRMLPDEIQDRYVLENGDIVCKAYQLSKGNPIVDMKELLGQLRQPGHVHVGSQGRGLVQVHRPLGEQERRNGLLDQQSEQFPSPFFLDLYRIQAAAYR